MENPDSLDPEGIVITWRIDITPEVLCCIVQFIADPITAEPSSPRPLIPLAIPYTELKRLHANLGEALELLERIAESPQGERPS